MKKSIPAQTFSGAQALLLYASINRAYFNAAAVFADETANFVSPSADGRTTRFAIRTARRNVDKVFLHIADDAKADTPRTAIPAVFTRTDGIFDIYTAEAAVSRPVRYAYSIAHDGRTYLYNKKGLRMEIDHAYDFTYVPGFASPDWAKGAVVYQIYVDRFCNGDPANDVTDKEYIYLGNASRRISDWDASVEPVDVCNFYGGDLQGVIDKMPYLKELGVEAIYLNPIFVSPSNHKYDIQDYDYIDPHFGVIEEDGGQPLTFDTLQNRNATKYMKRTTDKTNLEASNALFATLVACAHQNGIRVILDGVFNHCGAWNKWLDKENFYSANGYPAGAFDTAESAYHDYFRWNNGTYDSWWGHTNHPKLHYEGSQELQDYMMRIAAKWVSPPYNADGWRLDVAADLGYSPAFNHTFWRAFREAVKAANPDALILAEHYGDPSAWLDGAQWDTVMNYDAFMEPVTWFLTGMEKHSESARPDLFCNAITFEESMRYYMARLPLPALETAMNQLSNHDHSRFLTRTNRVVGRLHTLGAQAADDGLRLDVMMEAVALQMTWLGAPTVYYGDEAGLSGWTDPDNRRTYPWGHEDQTLLAFHKEMIRIRRTHAALKRGSLEFLYMNTGIISYGRWLDGEIVIAVFNNNETARTLEIPVWKATVSDDQLMRQLIATGGGAYVTEGTLYPVHGGVLEVTVSAFGSFIAEAVRPE